MKRKQPTLLTLFSAKRRSSDTSVQDSGAHGAEARHDQEAPVAADDHDERSCWGTSQNRFCLSEERERMDDDSDNDLDCELSSDTNSETTHDQSDESCTGICCNGDAGRKPCQPTEETILSQFVKTVADFLHHGITSCKPIARHSCLCILRKRMQTFVVYFSVMQRILMQCSKNYSNKVWKSQNSTVVHFRQTTDSISYASQHSTTDHLLAVPTTINNYQNILKTLSISKVSCRKK